MRRARYFWVNRQHPFYREFRKIVIRSVGVEDNLKNLMIKLKGVKLAILYGFFAKGWERKDSDVDILIVGKTDVEDDLLKELAVLEKRVQREINYRLYTEKEYRQRRLAKDAFLEEILSDQKVVLKGDPDAV